MNSMSKNHRPCRWFSFFRGKIYAIGTGRKKCLSPKDKHMKRIFFAILMAGLAVSVSPAGVSALGNGSSDAVAGEKCVMDHDGVCQAACNATDGFSNILYAPGAEGNDCPSSEYCCDTVASRVGMKTEAGFCRGDFYGTSGTCLASRNECPGNTITDTSDLCPNTGTCCAQPTAEAPAGSSSPVAAAKNEPGDMCASTNGGVPGRCPGGSENVVCGVGKTLVDAKSAGCKRVSYCCVDRASYNRALGALGLPLVALSSEESDLPETDSIASVGSSAAERIAAALAKSSATSEDGKSGEPVAPVGNDTGLVSWASLSNPPAFVLVLLGTVSLLIVISAAFRRRK